jgi:hypothetical protein
MAVNVILPFLYAWSGYRRQHGLLEKVLDLYRHYPGLPSNSIVRHMMGQLMLDARLVNSACRQQGLIHLYQEYCIKGKCGACVLSPALSEV